MRGTYTTQRYAAMPMETRGAVAEYADGRLTVWCSTQLPHILRTMLGTVLEIRESDIRVIAPDVGGGFGCKAELYPEEFLVAGLAMRLGRPVRYLEDRSEHLVATGHARDMVIDLEAATASNGRDPRHSRVDHPGPRLGGDLPTGLRHGVHGARIAHRAVPHRRAGGPGPLCRHEQDAGGRLPRIRHPGGGLRRGASRRQDRRETGADRLELRRRMLLRPTSFPTRRPRARSSIRAATWPLSRGSSS